MARWFNCDLPPWDQFVHQCHICAYWVMAWKRRSTSSLWGKLIDDLHYAKMRVLMIHARVTERCRNWRLPWWIPNMTSLFQIIAAALIPRSSQVNMVNHVTFMVQIGANWWNDLDTYSISDIQTFNADVSCALGHSWKEIYGPNGPYFIVPLGIVIGLGLPVIPWLIYQKYGWKWLCYVELMNILTLGWPLSNIHFYICKYCAGWFRKYNYLFGTGINGGAQIFVLIFSECTLTETSTFALAGAGGVTVLFPERALNPAGNATLGDWEPVKSTKMDVCAKICKHYLFDNNIPDVEFNEGVPIFPGLEVPSQIMNRRIFIYSESPMVLELYGMKTLGETGLNLTICDVIILFNQPWSLQETCQICGRAHRQPQKKVVKVIHLLVGESSNILLNQITLQKEDMFNAFANKDLGKAFAELLDIMTDKAVCHPGDESDELSSKKWYASTELVNPENSNVTSAPFKKRKNCTKKTQDACREQEESKSEPKWKSKSMTKVKSKLWDTTDTDFEDMNKVEGNRIQVEGGDLSMKGIEGVLDTDGPMMELNGNSPEHFNTDMRSISPEILNTSEKESLGWKRKIQMLTKGYGSGSQYKTGGESSNEMIPAHCQGTVLGSNERWFQPYPSLL
ncbi:hypothetical protein BU17DRAFT_68522 [Hysterangium stoloniferum]|nr:hypothetical protein BU17DRAFT_68522 [Hysterangium stoloniferum]